MLNLRAELHTHTVLSPCAELEMLPPLIVHEAVLRGIQLLAITDHNATGNIRPVQRAAIGTGVTILPGMELQTREEVHVLPIFDELENAQALQTLVDSALPGLRNNVELFGDQLIVDENGEYVEREPLLLLTSVNLTLNQVYDAVCRLQELMIPAHVNRLAKGMIPTLGFIPDDIPYPALEISREIKPASAVCKFPELAKYPLIQGGDAHRLEDLHGVNLFSVGAPTVKEILLAFANQDGRSVRILSQMTLYNIFLKLI